ncbi:MAG: hypothetical protein L0216_18330, partial [Planctomycetales bacterium]|nr:hypothetical protein [Planctomycetales bacterium]
GSDEGRPILASMRYGLGRTVYIGTDETWRWRLLQGDRLYYRFWQNLIRYVGHNRLLGEQKRFHIALDKTAYTLGERVVVRARVFQEDFQPLRAEEVEARLEKPRSGGASEPLPLRAVDRERRPGVYEGSIVAGTLGPHQVWFPLRGAPGEQREESRAGLASFEVTIPQREFEKPSMDRDTLAAMARESGGATWDLWQLPEIPAKVKRLSQTLSGVESVHRLWDSWGVFGALVALLCLEWIARKLARLP